MRVIFLIFVLLFVSSVGLYYAHILKRIFQVRKLGYSSIIIYFISFFLSFNTINMFSTLGIFLLHFLAFSLFTEFLNFFLRKVKSQKFWPSIYRFGVIPLFLTMVFFFYGFVNIRNLKETTYTIYTDKEVEPMKILFLSDSHYGTVLKKNGLEKFKNDVNQKEIDFILLGGDIVDENTTKEEMQEIFSILGSLKNKYGVYFVYGNHDRQKYSRSKKFTETEFNQVLSEENIQVLSDKTTTIGNVLLVGREDLNAKRKTVSELLVNKKEEDFVLLMDHQPVEYEANANLGVDLMVSGHTHAGQIFPAGYFIKWFHMADLWYGHEQVRQMDAIVSSGLAGWGYPIRTQKKSEYVIINIEKK